MNREEYARYWSEQKRKAQKITVYTIGGKDYPRTKYGEEEDDWGALSGDTCHDCGVQPGEYHTPNCDVERCPKCKGQALSCECDLEFDDDEETKC